MHTGRVTVSQTHGAFATCFAILTLLSCVQEQLHHKMFANEEQNTKSSGSAKFFASQRDYWRACIYANERRQIWTLAKKLDLGTLFHRGLQLSQISDTLQTLRRFILQQLPSPRKRAFLR